jgi:beta-lactamase superfamily II metal-dependent hydrolase
VGPSNAILAELARSNDLDTNHMSVLCRLRWGKFSMVLSGDAQMENWAQYDREGMLQAPCKVLKTSHHGSCNGTQWERLQRLGARCVIVSSDPDTSHHLPDLVGASVFARMEALNRRPSTSPKKIVALTRATGTIEIRARSTGGFDAYRYGEEPAARIDLTKPTRLKWDNNPTDWAAVLRKRVQEVYGP